MNFSEQLLADLLARIRYPVPGIWRGPAFVHLPSGNLVLQIATVRCGPLDPVPVFTYNSLASRDETGFGRGVSDLFNPTVENQGGAQADLITGTGRYLVYTNVVTGAWSTAPNSTRNGLRLNADNTWTERQPDGIDWEYHPGGCLKRLKSPSGDIWTVARSGGATTITAPTGSTTSYSPSGVTHADGRVTALSVVSQQLRSVTYPDGGIVTLSYLAGSDWALLSSVTDAGDRHHQCRGATLLDFVNLWVIEIRSPAWKPKAHAGNGLCFAA